MIRQCNFVYFHHIWAQNKMLLRFKALSSTIQVHFLTGHHTILLPATKKPPTVDRLVRTIAFEQKEANSPKCSSTKHFRKKSHLTLYGVIPADTFHWWN